MPELSDVAMQTNWKYPKNAVVQCLAREFTVEQKSVIESSTEYREFIKIAAPR